MASVGNTWAGIVRVSHMGGRKAASADFHSEREQIAALRDAVTKVGGELEVLPSELDVSGGLPLEQRPALRAAVEGVERGTYAGIVVAYQSRLGRDVEHEEAVWRRVEKAGGQILMALDGIDTSTVDGKMVRRIKSAMNTAERERHVERFDELRRWATDAGIWQRRQTPLGYQRDPQTRRLTPDDQADAVRDAFRARAAGVAMVTIAEQLGMTTSGIRYLLKNRVYLGELRVGRYVNGAAHEPIITEDEFLAARSSQPTSRPRRRAEPALLAGLVRCTGCGHVMSLSTQKVETYTCHGRMSAGRCPAPAGITARLLDEHVEAIALGELARLSTRAVSDTAALDRARERLREAEAELERFLIGVQAARLDPEVFANAARERQTRVDAAREHLGALTARGVPAVDGDPVVVWERLSVTQRNRLLRGLIEVVLVQRAGGRGRVVPVTDRVRVVAFGAGLIATSARGGEARPIETIVLPDADHPAVLRVQLAE